MSSSIPQALWRARRRLRRGLCRSCRSGAAYSCCGRSSATITATSSISTRIIVWSAAAGSLLDRRRPDRGLVPHRAVGAGDRHRVRLAGRRHVGARARPVDAAGMAHRWWPSRRALRAVRHHCAGRIAAGDRRHLRRHAVEPDHGDDGVRHGVSRQRRDVGGLFQRRRRARQPSYLLVGRSRTAGPQRLHIPPYPDRRRHHRLGGGRRVGARPSRPAMSTARPCWSCWAGRRSICWVLRCSSG